MNTTAKVMTGSVHFAAAATGAVVAGGVGLATMPVQGVAGLVSGLSGVDSPGALVSEFVGRAPARRCSRGSGRVWIEVRGLHDPHRGPEVAERVLSALRPHPGVRSADVNVPLSRVVVSLDDDAPAVRQLCALVKRAEAENQIPAPSTGDRPIDLPATPRCSPGG